MDLKLSSLTNLTQEEKERLSILLEEMKSRGIKIDQQKVKKQHVWPLDPSGYFVKSDGRRFNPNENQLGFLRSDARFSGLVSGRGGGKSCVGAHKALHKIMQGENGAVLNADFENFRVATWPEFREWIPWSMVAPKHRYRQASTWEAHQPFVMTFVNGARVICKGLKDPDSARGPNINWLWYDEAGRDRDGLAWLTAIASVRIGNDPQAWITTTPRGKNHWIYRFFVQQDIPQEALELFAKQSGGKKLVDIFFTTLNENKDNLDPGFVASLLASYPTGYLRDQEIYGKFVDEGGRLGDRRWFDGKLLDVPPEIVKGKVRFWDLAATEKKLFGRKSNDPDETVGTLLSWDSNNNFVIENQESGFWEWKDIKDVIKRIAISDGWTVKIRVEQEPAAGGKNQVAELVDFIHKEVGIAWDIEGYRPEGDRVQAANVWFAEASQGKFFMVRGAWNEPFFLELDSFPDPDVHDDKITSMTGARLTLAPIHTWKQIEFLHL